MTDAELVGRALAGDPASYGQLVDRYRGTVQGLAYHWTGDFDDAQDTVQEAFVQAYLHLGQLRDPERFGPWLRQLTANQCRRQWQRQRERSFGDGEEALIPCPRPSPADELEQAERRQLLSVGLGRLSQANRLVVCLHYLGGMPYAQIASFLDISANAVAARLHRARHELKEGLMHAVADGLRHERLGDQFTREVLEQALQRARQTQSRWSREEFVLSVDQGLEAARQLEDRPAEVEILSLLGEAGATWMSQPAVGARAYEEALALARVAADRGEEARLLRLLYQLHLRQGQWAELQTRAEEALVLCRQLGDPTGQALARAALDLAAQLPGAWAPDQPGGYALADFPLEAGLAGFRWGDLLAERRYSWGCPSRCAALVFLHRPRRFLGPSLELGARWEDPVPHQADAMGWSTDPACPEPVACSEVVRVGQTLVTLAGPLPGCVAVTTTIAPTGGGRAQEFSLRSLCGTRQAWYAPGVGLVKLRHYDQNGTRWLLWLVAHDGPPSQALFPLEPGRWWRYQWAQSLADEGVFEDLCRVVTHENGVAHLSSATWGREQSSAEVLAALEAERTRDRAAADLESEAFALEAILARAADRDNGGDPVRQSGWHQQTLAVHQALLDRARATGDLAGQVQALDHLVGRDPTSEQAGIYDQELLRLARQQGDSLRVLAVEHRLEARARQLTPAEAQQGLERRLALARYQGRQAEELELLSALAAHHQGTGEGEQAANRLEEHAQVVQALGDPAAAALLLAQAELHRAIGRVPEGPYCAYQAGTGELREQDAAVVSVGSGCWLHSAHYPVGSNGAPTSLVRLCPFTGSELLAGALGLAATDWLNYGITVAGANLTESLRTTSILVGRQEAVTVPAGQYTDCALVETVIRASAEPRPVDPDELARARGYLAGTKQAWFAPGVGLVRLRYAHDNGQVTEVGLTHEEPAEAGGGYLGLTVDHGWDYRWTDAVTGTVFEEHVRVAAHHHGQWHLALVTRACLPPPG